MEFSRLAHRQLAYSSAHNLDNWSGHGARILHDGSTSSEYRLQHIDRCICHSKGACNSWLYIGSGRHLVHNLIGDKTSNVSRQSVEHRNALPCVADAIPSLLQRARLAWMLEPPCCRTECASDSWPSQPSELMRPAPPSAPSGIFR